MRVEFGEGTESATELGGRQSLQDRIEFTPPQAVVLNRLAGGHAGGNVVLGVEPSTETEGDAADTLVDGFRIGLEGLLPKADGLGETANGGVVENGEDLLFARLADEVTDVAIGDFLAVANIGRQLSNLGDEHGGVGADEIDELAGGGWADALAVLFGCELADQRVQFAAFGTLAFRVAAEASNGLSEIGIQRKRARHEDQRGGGCGFGDVTFEWLAVGADEAVGVADEDYAPVDEEGERRKIVHNLGERGAALFFLGRPVVLNEGEAAIDVFGEKLVE